MENFNPPIEMNFFELLNYVWLMILSIFLGKQENPRINNRNDQVLNDLDRANERIVEIREEQADEIEEDRDDKEKFRPNAKPKKLSTKKERDDRIRQEQKEYIEQNRLAKEQKRQKEEESRQKIEDKRQQKEFENQEKEALEKKIKEEKEKEEYEKWRHLMTVDESGDAGDKDFSSNSQLLTEFIDYIKKQKVVVLEELAAKFDLKIADVIDRVKSLERDGFISGIIDDRGKFIYLSQEELNSVVSFIKTRGRVSIAELAQESNELIHLEQQEDKIEIDSIKLE